MSLLRQSPKSMLRRGAYTDPVSAIKKNAAAKSAREAGSSIYRNTSGLTPNRGPHIPGVTNRVSPRGAFDTGISPRATIGMEPRVSGGKARETQGLGYHRGNRHTEYSREERRQVLAAKRDMRRKAERMEKGAPGDGLTGLEEQAVRNPNNPQFDRRTRDSLARRAENEKNRHPDHKDTPGNSPLDRMPKPGSGLRSTGSILRSMLRNR